MGQITKEQIINVVCEVCGIRPEDLQRRIKEQDVVMARHFIAHYMFLLLNCSIRTIAQTVGVQQSTLYKPLFYNPVKIRSRTEDLLRERYNILEERLWG